MPFDAVPAAIIDLVQHVVTGDVFIPSFSRKAFLSGVSASVLAAAPPLTFTANLRTITAPVRNYDLATFAGLGLSIETTIVAGNAPAVAVRDVQVFNVAATTHTYVYSTGVRADQLLIMAVASAALTTIATPTGWLSLDTQAGTESRLSIFTRVASGDEPEDVPVIFGTASGAVIRTWMVDIADGVEALAGINDSAAGTSLDLATITPTWATAPTNNLYIAVLALAGDVAVSVFPTGYTVTGQDTSPSATANIDCALAYAERSALGSTENPTAFTYGASRATAFILAVKPKVMARLNWDGLGVQKAGSLVGTRRTVNIIDGANILTTVTDNVGADRIDITIANSGGAGSQGWPSVLSIDPHSGVNNPFVDTGQFMTFSTSAATQVTGQIRSDDPFHIHVDTTLEIQAHDTIDIHGPDRITIECTGGSPIHLLSSARIDLESTGSSIKLNPGTFVDVINGFVKFSAENAASTATMAAGESLYWTKDTSSPANEPYFTGDDNVDHPLFTAISENGAAVLGTFSRINFDDSTKVLVTVADLGGRQANVIYSINPGSLALADLVAITAKSVVANATNASAVPTALAATTAFQHLRVNSANNALEWSVLTSGAFPANTVPIASIANIATASILGRVTAATGAVEVLTGTQATTLLNTFNTLKGLVPGTTSNTTDFLRADGTFAVPPGTGAVTGLQFVTYGSEATLSNERVTTASTSITINTTVGSQIAFERAALTGDVTATANSNATTIANDAVTYAKMQNVTATARIIGRITAGAGDPEEMTGAQATTLLDNFTSTLKGLTPLSGGGTTNFLRADGTWAAPPGTSTVGHTIQDSSSARTQRANLNFDATTSIDLVATDDAANNQTDITAVLQALTGAITTTTGGVATSFGALAAKSVLANATNASAVPAALAATVAFQHLRVNSANTGLEWSVLTTGDFPAASVPLTALPTQAANTILANATAGVAAPTAVANAAESVFGQTSGNLGPITSAVQTILMRAAGSVFWGAAAADQTLRRSGSGDLAFGTLVTNNIGNDQVTYAKIQNVSATSRILGRITAAAGDIEELTGTQATTLLNNFTNLLGGLAPASGGGTTNFLRADGTWAAPPGSATAGHTIQESSTGRTQRANLNFDDTTSILLFATDDSGNNQTDITAQRAALTGDVTSAQNSNTTAIAAGVIVDADVNASAAIAMTKTGALTGDVTKASGSSTTAIGTGVIVNADVNASAAIALSKLDLTDSVTWTGAHTWSVGAIFNGSLNVAGSFFANTKFALSGVLTNSSTGTAINNLSVTGVAVVRFTGASPGPLSGMVASTSGGVVILINESASTITIQDAGAGSSASNRFALANGTDKGFLSAAMAMAYYDDAISNWVLMGVN